MITAYLFSEMFEGFSLFRASFNEGLRAQKRFLEAYPIQTSCSQKFSFDAPDRLSIRHTMKYGEITPLASLNFVFSSVGSPLDGGSRPSRTNQ